MKRLTISWLIGSTWASRQDLRCLPFCSWFAAFTLLAAMDVSKYRNANSVNQDETAHNKLTYLFQKQRWSSRFQKIRDERINNNASLLYPKGNVFKIRKTENKAHKLRAKQPITKIYLYNFDPFKPHFYIVKLGFTGKYIVFHVSAQTYRLWVPTIYVLSRNI